MTLVFIYLFKCVNYFVARFSILILIPTFIATKQKKKKKKEKKKIKTNKQKKKKNNDKGGSITKLRGQGDIHIHVFVRMCY